MRYFVCFRIDSAVQSELLAVQADHLFVDRELIRSDRQNQLLIGFVYSLMDHDVTPFDSNSSKN